MVVGKEIWYLELVAAYGKKEKGKEADRMRLGLDNWRTIGYIRALYPNRISINGLCYMGFI